MGYTHYLYRAREFDPTAFRAAVADLRMVILAAEIPLAGWDGCGEPVLTDEAISLNGVEHCGHRERDYGIAWPAPSMAEDGGTWFAGVLVSERTCDGDCSHETFLVRRVEDTPQPWRGGLAEGRPEYFSFCKTAYKPYDLIVTAAMIILKHHLGAAVYTSSDGDTAHDHEWKDAMRLCQRELGYGADFVLDSQREGVEA